MLMRYATLLLFCAGATTAFAQQAATPRLIVGDPKAAPIEIRQVSIATAISGGMAETTVSMVFFNPNRRQLEGNVQFPIADGQQITAFALDIDGAMRPAVPVDKARGRQVFEEVQRRRVDPGLLEVTQGNNFKLRVYPIAAGGTRSVEIKYTEILQRRDASWVYRLPRVYADARHADLTVQVNDTQAPRGGDLAFAPYGQGFRASRDSRQGKPLPSEGIEVLTVAHAEPQVFRQQLAGTSWFVAEVPVKSARIPRPAPKVIGLLWDSSGSGARRALGAELAELERYFAALSNVEVRLTRLRDRPEAQQVFKIEGGNWSALRRALEQTAYDGASALNDWQPQEAVDQYLLFSDGLSNYGGARFPALGRHQQLFALNSSPSADTARLAALAERPRGQLIAVDHAAPGTAANALLFQDALIEQLSGIGASDIEVDSHTVRNGMLRVAGRMTAPQAELTMTLSNGGKSERISVPVGADAPAHPNAGATWAGFRLRALAAEFEAHRAEIGRIGRRFGIPTRETSLIVLEQVTDYVQYDIEPPAKLLAEYRRLKAEGARQAERSRKDHFAQVLQMTAARKTWWNTNFSQTPPQPPMQEQSQQPFVPQQQSAGVIPVNAARTPAANMPEVQISAARPVMRVAEGASPITVMSPAAPVAMLAPPPSPPAAKSAPAPEAYMPPAEMKLMPAEPAQAQIGIALKKWVPNAPYMRRLRAASGDRVYQAYLDQKADYANSSAFFLDAADILLAKGKRDLALRVLSNLAEMELENRAVLRILGYRLLQAGAPALAVPVFEEVLRIAEEEPQSFRDLGLALAAAGQPQAAIEKLYEVALRPWDDRFPDIESIALADMNAIIATSGRQLDLRAIDKRLHSNLPLDLRIVLTWDADNTDIDLHVIDPNGEECFYGHNATFQGGVMSRDFTGGYGPEEFALRRAKPGKYKVVANFFGNQQQVLAGATTLQLKLTSRFGTTSQKEKLITLRLKEANQSVYVGEFEVKP